MQRSAGALDDVSTGESSEAAVWLPKPEWWRAAADPRELTPVAKDLSLRMTATHRDTLRLPLERVYYSERSGSPRASRRL